MLNAFGISCILLGWLKTLNRQAERLPCRAYELTQEDYDALSKGQR